MTRNQGDDSREEQSEKIDQDGVSVDGHGHLDVESTQHFGSADVIVEGPQPHNVQYIHERGDWIIATRKNGGCTLYDADKVSLSAVAKYYEQYPDWRIIQSRGEVDIEQFEEAMGENEVSQ